MRFLFICFVFSISETLILDSLSTSFMETERRSRLRFYLFVLLFILSALKLTISNNRLATGVFPLVAFSAICICLKRNAGLSCTQIVKVFLTNIVLSFCVDMFVMFIFSRLVQKTGYPSWNSLYMVANVVLSNSIQIMVVFMIETIRKNIGNRIGQEEKDTKQMNQLIIIFQFVMLGACLFYEMDKYNNVYLTTLLIGEQICFSVAAVYLILKNFYDDDVERLQKNLRTLELQNQLVYQYYQELEEYEQNLYRIRHDFNNLMYAAATMANKGEFEVAEEMINEMKKMVERNIESTRGL